MTHKAMLLAKRLLRKEPTRMREFLALVREAAAEDDPEAKEALGSWLLEGLTDAQGIVVRRNRTKGVSLLQEAASAGNLAAKFRLGYCYDVGEGMPIDKRRARKLYLEAWRGGEAWAALNMAALCRENGDRRGQIRWLRKAAANGLAEGVLELARETAGRKTVRMHREFLAQNLKTLIRSSPSDANEARGLLKRLL